MRSVLHGEIKINGHIIMEWRAVRLEGLREGNNEYAYSIGMVDYGTGQEISGELTHRYTDGAHVLVGKIMRIWEHHHGKDLESRGRGGDVQASEERQGDLLRSIRTQLDQSQRVGVSASDVSPSSGDGSEGDSAFCPGAV